MHEFFRRQLDFLERAEHWPYADVLAYQAGLIERLARHVRDNVPPFAERVRPLFDGDSFRLDRWRDVPVLTRQDLRASAPALEQIELPGGTRPFSSSGSTGEPVKGRHTAVSDGMLACMRERLYRWHDLDPNKRMALLFLSPEAIWPEGKAGGNWSQRGERGTSHRLDVLTPSDRQLDWLARIQPDYLSTTSATLLNLALLARECGMRLKLEAAVVTGTRLYPEIRKLAAEVFGLRAIEAYGAEETGFIAIQCPDSELLHVCAEHVMVEIIDAEGAPVPPGQTGRVLVTSLHNLATPLLRYEIGDLAETTARPCVCGRSLPPLKSIVGRERRPVTLPNGSRLRPTVLVDSLRACSFLPATHVQVVQTAPTAFEVRYVPDKAAPPLDEPRLREHFSALVPAELQLSFVPVARIERAANGKYEDFVYLAS
jgi:phenylacetate-CoA ligase